MTEQVRVEERRDAGSRRKKSRRKSKNKTKLKREEVSECKVRSVRRVER